jgi:broad specificity phosphatase PhoE
VTVHVHFVRHGEVASHRGDVPVTPSGLEHAKEQGKLMGEKLLEGEHVYFYHTITKRTKQTAEMIRAGIMETVQARGFRHIQLYEPCVEDAIRNPDIYLGGLRVELVSSLDALLEQTTGKIKYEKDYLKTIPFWPQFIEARDRIGYWLHLQDPPGENAHAVARRVMTFATSLTLIPGDQPRRYIFATHSPVLRAFLINYLLDDDPGEPEYCESIDLTFRDKGKCIIKFRNFQKKIKIF